MSRAVFARELSASKLASVSRGRSGLLVSVRGTCIVLISNEGLGDEGKDGNAFARLLVVSWAVASTGRAGRGFNVSTDDSEGEGGEGDRDGNLIRPVHARRGRTGSSGAVTVTVGTSAVGKGGLGDCLRALRKAGSGARGRVGVGAAVSTCAEYRSVICSNEGIDLFRACPF